MNQIYDQFTWWLPRDGYEFVSVGGEEYLVGKSPWSERSDRPYSPLIQYTGLFRQFGWLAPDKSKILDFAERHGSLLPRVSIQELKKGTKAESLSLWAGQIHRMKFAVAAWDILFESINDPEEISERMAPYMDLMEPYKMQAAVVGIHSTLGGLDYQPPYLAGKEVSLSYVLSNVLRLIVNESLEEHVSTQLLISEQQSTALYHCPKNLLGAIWLQLASAIDVRKEYARCTQCGDYFEISPGTSRPDKKYCSTRCKSRAQRERAKAKHQSEVSE